MDQITNQIYIGNFQDAFNLEELKKNNITAVLCVAEEIDDGLPDWIIYHHIPLIDCSNKDEDPDCPELLNIAVSSLETMVKGNHIVLVHCVGGVSRSATVVSLYIAKTENISLKTAIKKVKQKRPQADPSFNMLALAKKVIDLF